jgi:hypothetical protein
MHFSAEASRSYWKTTLIFLVAATLVMGAGWGIRGSFGHCRGAMMPGAMLGLVVAACAGRPDWWGRAPIMGLLAGIGWAVGGSSSYGLLVGYTLDVDFWKSTHGYFSLMIVGALYGSLGCGLLGLSVTQSRSFLERALWPMLLTYLSWLLLDWTGVTEWSLSLVAKDPARPQETHWLFDTVWIYALATLPISGGMLLNPKWRGPASLLLLMAVGWWLTSFLLIGAIGIRINPSRNDSWAGVLGVLLGLTVYLVWNKNRASLMLLMYGLIGGGVGFPVGQFLQALGRLRYGPMESVLFLKEVNHWTLMEQTFGYCMGLAAALGIAKLVRHHLSPPVEDHHRGWLNWVAAWALFGLLIVFNAGTNYRRWQELELIKPEILQMPAGIILTFIAVAWLLFVAWALAAQRFGWVDLLPASSKGKAQLIALLMMVTVFSLYVMLPSLSLPTALMFIGALAVGGLGVLHAGSIGVPAVQGLQDRPTDCQYAAAEDDCWRLGWPWLIAILVMLLLQLGLAFWTCNLPR